MATETAHITKGEPMREKLIEELTYLLECELACDCSALAKERADRLIASGVVVSKMETTTDKDTNVPSKWIPVTERLPEEEGWYLVYTTPNREHKSINKARFCKGYAWGNFEPYWCGAGGHWANVTHWMPMPEAPKGE